MLIFYVLQAQEADSSEPGSTSCSTGELSEDHQREDHQQLEEEHEGHTIGSHRRLLPGVFGRGTIPFRVGYPGRIGRMAGRGGLGRGGPDGSLQEG